MIGGNGEVRGAAAQHTQDRREHASNRGDLAAIAIARGRERVIVAEQLVCAIDQKEFQGVAPAQPYRIQRCLFKSRGRPDDRCLTKNRRNETFL